MLPKCRAQTVSIDERDEGEQASERERAKSSKAKAPAQRFQQQ